jgi:glycosyltransferase involved in cell wall biosynthesis
MGGTTNISGFTFARDAVKLDYPLRESILSALPLVDEYIVHIGACTDDPVEQVESIGDPRIRIIRSTWDPSRYVHGATNADQTNIALDQCSSPWCLYLQADEVLHEQDYGRILDAVAKYGPRADVEGLLFHYNHFWGDYGRVQRAHNWYSREIRIVRNIPGIRSWKSAQSFRRDGMKLRAADTGAFIYHYGWVRHPEVMRRKTIALDSLHHGRDWVDRRHPEPAKPWDYGPLDRVPRFTGTHPGVMTERIRTKSWRAEDFADPDSPPDHRHLRPATRLLSALERLLGRKLGEYRNYIPVR